MKRFFAIALAVVLGLGAVSCNKHLEPTELTKNDFPYKVLIEGTVSISGSGSIGGASVEITYNGQKYVSITETNGFYSIWMPTAQKSGNVYLSSAKATYTLPSNGQRYTGYSETLTCTVNTVKVANITMNKD